MSETSVDNSYHAYRKRTSPKKSKQPEGEELAGLPHSTLLEQERRRTGSSSMSWPRPDSRCKAL